MERQYPARPVIGIGVVVWRAGRVLLVQRGRPPRLGEWSLPGGAQELGESIAEAARREVREETAVEISAPVLLDVVDLIQRDADGAIAYHYTLIDLAAAWQSGTAQAGSDAAAIAWADPNDLDGYGLWAETCRIIGLAQRLFTGQSADG